MAADTLTIAKLLEASLDSRQNKEAEIALRQEEKKPQFSIVVLQIVADGSQQYTTRLASALCFKNFVKRSWTDAYGNHKLPQDEVTTIKKELLGLMVSMPPGIQAQLGDAISVIADSDFYERWDTLVDDLVSRLTPDNAVVNNGVLHVAHSIFKRWRPLFRSDELFNEINHVVNRLGAPLLTLLQNTDQMVEANSTNKEALQQLFTTLNLIFKLFNDLNCQDLPPVFEDNLGGITTILQKYLTYDNALLHTEDDSESGPQEYARAEICEFCILFATKYEDAFGPYISQFITSAWNLLTTIGPETKYDILVSKALQFLTAVAADKQHAANFNNQEILEQVVEKVVLPNLALREADLEMFEDEPIEFIHRDLEGSDSDTRRRAATDFLRRLMEQYEQLVTSVVSKYIEHFTSDYAKDPKNNWKSKDTAVYLFSSIAAKGVSTSSAGIKSTNQLVDVISFFEKNIASDLISDGNVEPLLKVDAIKYLYTFRSQMTKEQWHQAFPLLVQCLGSSNYVVYTYAAIAVERVLSLTNDSNQPVFTREEVQPLSQELLAHLFQLMEKDPAPEKIQENEFLMRCVMRVLIVIKDGVLPITDVVLEHLIYITRTISKNPSNPRFYYYHFEALGALIRFAAPSQPAKLETELYTPFALALQQEVQEFMPYVFQLFAALLEANPSGTLSEYYKSIIPPMLLPGLWEFKGNIPALVRLLSSMIQRGSADMIAAHQIEPVLGIFQKLISTKTNESNAFDLLESVIVNFPVAALQPYFVPMLNIMLMRLEKSKTEAFTQRFVRFYHLVSARVDEGLGADFFIGVAEQVQTKVFVPLYLTIILPTTQKLSRPLDRKTAVLSLTRTLTDSAAFANTYPKGWTYTCDALLKLLEEPPLPLGKGDDLILDHDLDDVGFGVGFTPLNTCRKPLVDPWPQVGDLRKWVGKTVAESTARHGGRVQGFVRDRLGERERDVLAGYMRL
ncbi:MAG: importin-alpha export receptor [Vezdaea acicularis]|nr:MAG: importin-alpha export receptor [Vezdaea acicularis]